MFHVKHKKKEPTGRVYPVGPKMKRKMFFSDEEERKECVKSSSPSAIYNIPQRSDIVNLKNKIF